VRAAKSSEIDTGVVFAFRRAARPRIASASEPAHSSPSAFLDEIIWLYSIAPCRRDFALNSPIVIESWPLEPGSIYQTLIQEPHDPWILLVRSFLPQTGSPLWRKAAVDVIACAMIATHKKPEARTWYSTDPGARTWYWIDPETGEQAKILPSRPIPTTTPDRFMFIDQEGRP
jgi:hypothetical protein